MERIVAHAHYEGMPAAIDEDGVIRWNAPSNRPPGSKHERLHNERLDWWRRKAAELGVPKQGHWISRVAKQIHPYGEKPCQTCGRVLSLDYVYPTRATLTYLNAHLPADAQLQYENFHRAKEAGRRFETFGINLSGFGGLPGTVWLKTGLQPYNDRRSGIQNGSPLV